MDRSEKQLTSAKDILSNPDGSSAYFKVAVGEPLILYLSQRAEIEDRQTKSPQDGHAMLSKALNRVVRTSDIAKQIGDESHDCVVLQGVSVGLKIADLVQPLLAGFDDKTVCRVLDMVSAAASVLHSTSYSLEVNSTGNNLNISFPRR
jgi:hypothetical protein